MKVFLFRNEGSHHFGTEAPANGRGSNGPETIRKGTQYAHGMVHSSDEFTVGRRRPRTVPENAEVRQRTLKGPFGVTFYI